MADTNSEAFLAVPDASIDRFSPAFEAAIKANIRVRYKPTPALLDEIVAKTLEAYEAAKWQPIDTARKDGTNIMLGNGVTVAVGKWARGDWRAMYFVCEGTDDFSAGAGLIYKPTHWQSLPKNPPV